MKHVDRLMRIWTLSVIFILIGLKLSTPVLAQNTPAPTQPTTVPVIQNLPELTVPTEMDALLARERWDEPMYGLSLRPPLGSRLERQSADEAILRILGEKNTYSISLEVKNLNGPFVLDQVVQQSVVQVANVHPQARILMQAQAKLMGSDVLGALFFHDLSQR
ncbi:MAG: hypothetical protein HC898_03405 [Phycisphaerales bacterium]|nr:hypothetical protein [Phycisphaerales bacterium]